MFNIRSNKHVLIASSLATLLSVLLSELIAIISLILFKIDSSLWKPIIGLSMVIPLIVASFVTYIIFTQLLRLQLAKEQIEEMGRMDFLTRIYNREYFLDVGNREFATAYRYNQSLTAIMIDLDNFKQINDVHGHVVGDQVIQESARIISSLIRQSDIFARFGGDEFVLLSPQSNLKEAEKLAKRIVQSISAKPVSTYLIEVKVTVSIGVAALTPKFNNIDKLINAADQALYRAKKTGRNTFCT